MAKVLCANPEAVVKRAFFLAWQACGGPLGMGFLQDPGRAVTEDDVWGQAYGKRDYPDGNTLAPNKPGDVYGDYVFGRMMKLSLKWDAEGVEFRDGSPRPDYQAWCGDYPTYPALIQAAIDTLK